MPLTNLHAGETLPLESLPYAYTAHTPCYRSEAGSYGKDTRGLIRMHEFSKVELVRIVDAARSRAELDVLIGHAEAVLQGLGLHHRVIKLAAGDTGFASQLTFDIEVWLPGQDAYREIASASDLRHVPGAPGGHPHEGQGRHARVRGHAQLLGAAHRAHARRGSRARSTGGRQRRAARRRSCPTPASTA